MLKWIDLLKLFKYSSVNILYLEFLQFTKEIICDYFFLNIIFTKNIIFGKKIRRFDECNL